ncbi:MAG: hypothetical protein GX455_17600 [Phycisphaerae bacterium]|nr:hypothetical protein [Phycisphaerae bacterium]
MNTALAIGGGAFEPAGMPVDNPVLSLFRREENSAGRSNQRTQTRKVPVTRRLIPETLYSRLRGYFTDAPAPLGLYIDFYA